MRIFLLQIITILALCALPQVSAAHHQVPEPRIVYNLSTSNGLSYNGVSDILIDSRGFTWIATYDGLNVHNGFSIKTYKKQINDQKLPSNRIRSLAEDHLGRIWIGTENGVTIYDYYLDSFTSINNTELSKSKVTQIIFSGEKHEVAHLLCENGSIVEYNTLTNKLEFSTFDTSTTFRNMIEIDSDNFLIASSTGLVRYTKSSKTYYPLIVDGLYAASTIARNPKGEIFVGLFSGFRRFDLETKSLYGQTLLPNYNIKEIFFDSSDGLWVSTTFYGVHYAPDYSANREPHFSFLMPNQRANAIRETSDKRILAGSDKGFFCIDSSKSKFNGVGKSTSTTLFLPNVFTLSDNSILIKSGTKIYTLDPLHHKLEDKTALFKCNTLSTNFNIVTTKDDDIWQFSARQICFYDAKKKRSRPINSPLIKRLPDRIPTCTEIDGQGNIWLGYFSDLVRINVDQNNSIIDIESFAMHPLMRGRSFSRIRHIYYDESTSSLWVGTDENGTMRMEIEPDKTLDEMSFQHYRHIPGDSTSLSSNFVTDAHRTVKGELYIATEQGGICRVIENEGRSATFKSYTEIDGLSNNVVKSISSDSNGNLWITTNIGLNFFDTQSKEFHTYRLIDGLPFEEFRYTKAKDHDGKIFLTGFDEVLYFDPLSLTMSEETPKVYFDQLSIGDNIIKPNSKFDNRKIIKKRLTHNDQIELRHDETPFAISIDALCANQSAQQYIYYKLEPNNKEWTRVPISENTLRFNALPHNNYTLHVKASNSFGALSEEISLNISILPPAWRSPWAYATYTLLAVLSIASLIIILMRFLKLDYQLRIEEQKIASIQELNTEKQRYFSGISHELKTPLALIIAPLTSLQQRFRLDTEVRNNLNSIQRQAKKMLQLVEIAHGVQLSDENRLELKRTNFYFDDLISDIISDFDQMAKYDQKSLSVERREVDIEVNADYSMIEKIFTNLINNAFKYTKRGDTIKISYFTQDKTIIVNISDSGKGIAENDIPHIFERYYTSAQLDKNNSAGTGIGLAFTKMIAEMHGGEISVDSILAQCTTFSVKIPIVVKKVVGRETYAAEIAENIPTKEQSRDNMVILSDFEPPIVISEHLSSSLIYVVDDNTEMRLLLNETLGAYFNVITFASAQECLDAMQSQWPDLVVSDVMMPEMSGDQMCQIIKNDIATSHIPIVLLTALDTIDDKVRGYSVGADAYISKPFHPTHLITRIEVLLQKVEQLRERFRSPLPLHKEESDAGSSKDRKLIERLYELFEENLDNENVEVESFLKELGLNRSVFFAKIKALTQLSPYELLKKFRLDRAAELLKSGEYNVNEVCMMTGFKSRTHFSRLFKDTFGVTPSKYCNL